MPGWVWVVIALVVVAVIGIALWQGLAQRRTKRLRGRFGPEYERVAAEADSRREAEAELSAREQRRQELEIRPLSASARTRYLERWQSVQAEFVDDPDAAVADADSLIQRVMEERGYPVEDFDQRAADVSVDHPGVVENYREGHRLANESASGEIGTEDLRRAMRHYRALFEELLDEASDEPLRRETPDHAHDGTRPVTTPRSDRR
jgi:hypothetical protein